jgi:phosphate-selective porin
VLASLVAAFCALIALAGCTTMGTATSAESLLQKAGFQSRTPTTAEQKAAYAKLPAYELHRGTLKGRTIYAYKDEKAGVVYLGSEAEYAQYKQLAVNAKMKEEQFTPAQTALDERDYREYNSWYLGRIP